MKPTSSILATTLILLFSGIIGHSQTIITTTTVAPFNISLQPSDQAACLGGTATFNVIALATSGTLTYQWQYASSESGTYYDITTTQNSTAKNATLTVSNVSSTHNGRAYKCKITHSGGTSKTSFAAALTVNTLISITTQPVAQSVCPGTQSFSVAATGGSLTYQWQYRNPALSLSFYNISGATAATYSFSASSTNNGYYYKCIVSNSCGSLASSAVKLTVYPTTAISIPPSEQTVCSGNTATFSVVAAGSGLTYQWQYCTTSATGTFYPLTGAAASYSVVANGYNNGYYYRCVVSGCGLAVTSAAAKLIVNTAPVIVGDPIPQTVCPGSLATFSVNATGSGLTYQWQASSTLLGTYSNITNKTGVIAGATSATLSVTASSSNDYFYQCIVSGTCTPAATSKRAKLTLYTIPTITSQPSNQSVLSGRSVTFGLTATGTGLTYQWQKSTTAGGSSFAAISGASEASYTFTAAEADNGFNFRCVVSGTCTPVVTSTVVSLTVTKNVSYRLASTGSLKTVAVPINIQSSPLVVTSLLNRITGKQRFVSGVEYKYSDLNSFAIGTAIPAFYSKFLYSCQSTCLKKILNSYKLVAVLNTGDINNLGSTAFNADVIFEIIDQTGMPIKDNTGANIPSIRLHIDHLEPEQVFQIEVDPASIAFVNNLQQLSIRIKSIPVADARVQNDLRLKVYFDADYGVDVEGESIISTTNPADLTGSVSSNPVILKWKATAACPELIPAYEIQMLRLYNTSGSPTYISNPEAVSATIDWSQALSILTESPIPSYALSVAEGSGYYMWRVRAIGDYYKNGAGNSENWGVWSIAGEDSDVVAISSVSALTTDPRKSYIFYYNQFDTDKNWIYNRVLTEEGKVSENIIFADGLGLAKQKQHKMQTQNQIIAGVNIADYVGRESVITMSAPINQNKLQYVNKLAQDESGGVYGPEDFDSDKRIQKAPYPVCDRASVDVPVWENPLPMLGPISAYYSDANNDINIPNAENYPYSRSVFHKDGRQKKTSLYGGEHRMGLYDETYMLGGLQRTVRTYYSAVSDTELIRVFGNETPADTGVYKMVKVDPNEVATVEYKTLEGKTIATCMVNTGDHPLLDDISENKDLIIKEIKGNFQKDPYTLLKEQVITFTDPTVQLNIDYLLNKKEFEANCINYCSTCDYIIELYIIREETDEVKWSHTYTLKPGVCGGNLTFEMKDGKSDSLASGGAASCSQMVLSATSAGTIMLSDPGNYRIGRKITVNNKYDGAARYRDYHADKINALLDTEAAKFDPLFSYLAEGGNLTSLYTYLDGLASGPTSACDDGETAESGKTRSLNFTNRFGSKTAAKFGSTTSNITSPKPTGNIWEVTYEPNVDDPRFGTYTLASSCLEIEVPKIPCDFNPCEALWKTTGTKKWQTDLIAEHTGYYDYEKMLTDKWSTTTFAGEASPNGKDLYNYFYDKYGERKYPSNAASKASFCIKSNEIPDVYETKTNILGNEITTCVLCYDGDEDALAQTLTPYLKITISPDGITPIEIPIELPLSSTNSEVSEPLPYTRNINLITANADGIISQLYAISTRDYGNLVASNIEARLKEEGYDYEVTSSFHVVNGGNDYATITISTDFSIETYPNRIDRDLQSISLSTSGGITLFNSTSRFSAAPVTASDFSFGNGAFNSMVTHMIMEEADGSAGDDYDCYDIYMIWEDIVNNYESLRASFVTSTGTGNLGLDLLEYFLEKTGKKYAGYSDHAYGKGDANSYLTSGITATSSNYGYGYLEYAYKAFKLDIPFYMDLLMPPNVENCLAVHGAEVESPISLWPKPQQWDANLCASEAWWDGTSVIADKVDEGNECKVWNGLYECVNSDFDFYAGALSPALGLACDNKLEDGCMTEFATFLTNRTLNLLDKRDLGITNGMRITDGMSESEAFKYSYNLRNELKKNLKLTPKIDPVSKKIIGLGSDVELELFRNLHNKGLTVSATNPALSADPAIAADAANYKPKVEGITVKKSKMVADELTAAFRNSEGLTESDVVDKLSSVYNKYGWGGGNTTSGKLLLRNSLSGKTMPNFKSTPIKRHANKLNLSFAVVGSVISVIGTADDLTSVPIVDLGQEAEDDIVIGGLYYKWGNDVGIVNNIGKNFKIPKDCDERNLSYVANKINYALDKAKECRLEKSLEEYDEKCTLPKNINDTLKISYTIDYHQYTLFYYDVVGNLIKVVPPQGADIFVREYVTDAMGNTTRTKPSRQDVKNHQYLTKYKYNSLGQRTYEETPDGGVKHFYYNSIGQVRFAQNEKQAATVTTAGIGVYEYYKYDALGRLTEAGLSNLGITDKVFASKVESKTYPTSGLSERMVSVYGTGSSTGLETYLNDGITEQAFLENRMQSSYSDADGIANSGDEIYTHYSYDPHGNVQWMASQIPGVAMKFIKYEYDLITQKVKEVKYNEGKIDQFFHRYSYDADNRVIAVETSRDGVIWDVDARYEYYAYGSMKRLSIGEDNIQGIDQVYTINGWLKGVNHQSLNSTYDPGHDGAAASTYGKDVFGMTLGYFDGDFKRTYTSGTTTTASPFNSEFNDTEYNGAPSPYYNTGINQLSWDYTNGSANAIDYRPLFNGTITNVAYSTQATGSGLDPLYDGKIKAMKYKYDELYRLTASSFDYFKTPENVWARTQTASVSALTDYNTSYTYDLAGNIETLNRYGVGGLMDKLRYHYEDKDGDRKKDNNRLEYVTDGVSNSPYPSDLETQSSGNYTYDEVGELKGDAAEGIKSIEWTRTAKVKKIIKEKIIGTSIEHTEIGFTYNGMDKRVSKTVAATTQFGTTGANTTTVTTYYMLDGKGQLMSIYSTDKSDGSGKLIEQEILSSERIGIATPNDDITLATNESAITLTPNIFTRTLGKKSYEIKDYLGNVRAVVSDEKQVNTDGTYSAKLLSSSDYMPYGMLMPNTDFQTSDYRYGYQGMEKDKELKGESNSYNFDARILDPRIGRWLSMDPLAAKFPDKSPYNAMGNDPINKIDPDGRSEDNISDGGDHSASYSNSHAFDDITPEASETMRAAYLFPVEIGLGFTPIGVALDAKDLYQAYQAGSRLGMALAVVGYVPFGDIVKPVVKGVWRSVGSNSLQAGVDLLQKVGIDPSAIAKINTKYSGVGNTNCQLTTLSVDEYLASGKAWSVDGSKPNWTNPETFASQAGIKISDFSYAKSIDDIALQEGDRGIVYGARPAANGVEATSHVFNVAKIDGQNVFIDGQLGRVIGADDIAAEGYSGLSYAVTGKIGDRR